jgi:secreted trypsin-like serine protease
MALLKLEGPDPTPLSNDDARAYNAHVCSGVLIAPDLVMTSAHCIRYRPPVTNKMVQASNGIEVGHVDLDDDGAVIDPYMQDRHCLYYENLVLDELIVHPQFDERAYKHDIMLVKVFGRSRYPPLRISRDNIDFQSATALGWGADSAASGHKFSNMLRRADVELMLMSDKCRDVKVEVHDPFSDATSVLVLQGHMYDNMMCATTMPTTGGWYICYGNTRGPVLLEGNGYDADDAYGVLSWNWDHPAVITLVSDHYDWIRETVCRKSLALPEQYDCTPGGGGHVHDERGVYPDGDAEIEVGRNGSGNGICH